MNKIKRFMVYKYMFLINNIDIYINLIIYSILYNFNLCLIIIRDYLIKIIIYQIIINMIFLIIPYNNKQI